MATTFVQGTKEYAIIDVTDKKSTLTTLDGTSPRFTVYDVSDMKWYDEEVAQNIGLTAYCLIDTSAAHAMGLWPPGEYRIDLTLDTPAETPILAPGRFTVVLP